MKIALSGKGGTGKTTIAATLARCLARRGRRVLAIDCDSNPNLATSLGLDEVAAARLRPMPRRALDDGRPVSDLLNEYGIAAPDGVQLVLAARIEQAGAGWTCGNHATVRGLLAEILSADAEVTVVDMEAGLEHLSRSGGTLRYVDHLLIVVEPYVKAVETARRTVALAQELGIPRIGLLASKVREKAELGRLEHLAEATSTPVIASIPYEESVRLADLQGLAPIDLAPDSELVRAVDGLAAQLVKERVPAAGWVRVP